MSDIQKLFKFINIETGVCKIEDLSYTIKDLSVAEAEELQDREAEINELNPSSITPKQVLQEARKWQNYILTLAFGEDVDIKQIKSKLTASQFKNLVSEVFAFLGNFNGPSGAQDYMTTLMAKQN